MLWIILGILISYLIGSIPTAYIFARLSKGIDIRKFGSGNIGATNAFRVLGKTTGIAVLFLDIFKGFISVVFLGNFLALRTICLSEDSLRLILGLFCISGHNWTLFLGFKGGKGIATTFGVLCGLAIKLAGFKVILGWVSLTWLVVFIMFKIVSLASVISGISLPIYMMLFNQSKFMFFFSIIISIFIILRHKSNLKRVFQGKEPRLF